MQLALRPYVTAGVAIVGASVIAATPITAVAPEIQNRAVTLSAAVQSLDLPRPADLTPFAAALADSSFVNPITRWAEVFELTATNLTKLFQNAAAEPFPVLRQIIENQITYGELIGTSLSTVVQNIINTVTMYIPDYLEEARAEFEAGDIMGVGNVMSRATLTVASSLFPMLNLLSIPNQMVGNLSSVLNLLTFKSFIDVGLVGQVGMGYVTVVQGFVSQGAARIGQDLYDAIQDRDMVKLASTIINAPADIVSAILNGSYVPPRRPGAPGTWTSGLLSPDRMYAPLRSFLIDIPRAIAAAIAPPVAAPRETPALKTAPEPEAPTQHPKIKAPRRFRAERRRPSRPMRTPRRPRCSTPTKPSSAPPIWNQPETPRSTSLSRIRTRPSLTTQLRMTPGIPRTRSATTPRRRPARPTRRTRRAATKAGKTAAMPTTRRARQTTTAPAQIDPSRRARRVGRADAETPEIAPSGFGGFASARQEGRIA